MISACLVGGDLCHDFSQHRLLSELSLNRRFDGGLIGKTLFSSLFIPIWYLHVMAAYTLLPLYLLSRLYRFRHHVFRHDRSLVCTRAWWCADAGVATD